jgi:hypothetical protein
MAAPIRLALWISLFNLILSVKATAAEPDDPAEASRARIEQALDAPIDLIFDETPLTEVAAHLRSVAKIPVQLDLRAIEDIGLGADTKVTFEIANVSLRSALRHLLRRFELTTIIRDESLLITTDEEAEDSMSIRVYSVRDLAHALDANGEEIENDGDLTETLPSLIAPNSWANVGGPGNMVPHHGRLVVAQSDDVHEQLAAVLAALRTMSSFLDAPADRPFPATSVPAYPIQPGNAKIERALAGAATLDLQETPLCEALAQLSAMHAIPIMLDHPALEDVGIDPSTPITLNLQNIRLAEALRHLLREDDLTFVVRDEVLVITTREEIENELRTVIYPVADLIKADGFRTVDEAGGELEFYVEMIQSTVAPNAWDEVGGPASIHYLAEYGALIVSQVPHAHAEIADLLTKLRATKPTPTDIAQRKPRDPNEKTTRIVILPKEFAEVDPVEMEELIRKLVAPNDWRDGAVLKVIPGRVVIHHTEAVHQQLVRFLFQSDQSGFL